jgi:phosphoglycolate/pyridoxal phosphate phosphatase family enzyme
MVKSIMDISKVKNFLLDMDGTIYLGDRLFEGTPRLLESIKAIGGRAVYLTNNSSKSPEAYVEKLSRLGISATLDDIFTSGDAAALVLTERVKNPKVYLLGTPALQAHLEGYGVRAVEAGEAPDFVLLGFDMTLTYEKLKNACALITAGVPFVATHPDLVCPVENGFIPDTGSMIKMFEAATGISPEIIGKPTANMARAVERRYGFLPEQTAMVGDRLSTDIKFGNNAGFAAILVLSGETDMEMYKSQSAARADFIFPSVSELADAISR